MLSYFYMTAINFNVIKKKWANNLVLAKKTGKTCAICDPALVTLQPI